MKTKIYEIQELSFQYLKEKPLLNEFSWEIQEGEHWAILGHSGCGKSTLLHLLGGLLSPKNGKIYFRGEELRNPKKEIQIILQEYGLFPWKTVWQNVELALCFQKEKKENSKEEVRNCLQKFGLLEYANNYPYELSGGERQRVAICRAMISRPEVLLMDEPFSALDELTREKLQEYVMTLAQEQKITTILVTHQIQEAVKMSNRILLFSSKKTPMIYRNDKKIENGEEQFFEICRELKRKLQEENNEV